MCIRDRLAPRCGRASVSGIPVGCFFGLPSTYSRSAIQALRQYVWPFRGLAPRRASSPTLGPGRQGPVAARLPQGRQLALVVLGRHSGTDTERLRGSCASERESLSCHSTPSKKRNLKLKAEFRSCLTQSGAKPSFDSYVSRKVMLSNETSSAVMVVSGWYI